MGVTDPAMFRRVFHPQRVPPPGFSRGYYENPEVEPLIDLASTALTEGERRPYCGKLQ